MTKIERLENLLVTWKARRARLDKYGWGTIAEVEDTIYCLELALGSDKKPPNTQMQSEACKRNPKECQFYDGVGCAGVPTLCTCRPR